MTPWQANHEPKHTLSIKYVKQILTPAEYKKFIAKYLAAKNNQLENQMSAQRESATGVEK